MIAEDERVAREEFSYMLDREQDIYLCPSAETEEQLLELYQEYKPDVLFLDIEMLGMASVNAVKKIIARAKIPPLFIFTTAYDVGPLEGIGVEVLDYLLKPFDYIRLNAVLDKVRHRLVYDTHLGL